MEKALLIICCIACLCNAISSFAIFMQLWSDNKSGTHEGESVKTWFKRLQKECKRGNLPGFKPSDFDLSFLDEDEQS